MKAWYICTVGYYSAMKSETIKFAGKWMEQENTILREITQIQKDKCTFSLFVIPSSRSSDMSIQLEVTKETRNIEGCH